MHQWSFAVWGLLWTMSTLVACKLELLCSFRALERRSQGGGFRSGRQCIVGMCSCLILWICSSRHALGVLLPMINGRRLASWRDEARRYEKGPLAIDFAEYWSELPSARHQSLSCRRGLSCLCRL
jgi:hypothetical protein